VTNAEEGPVVTRTDDGLFGPGSAAWKVIGHPGSLVGGLRSLIIQALHPHAMAGVDQHSNYLERPLNRLRGTAQYVAATTFGDTATAHRAAERVRLVHARVRGVDPVTGETYSADDPESLLWVHCVEWHSFLAAYRAFAGALAPEEEDRFIAEGVRAAALLGTPEDIVPASVAQMREYFQSVRPRLCVSAAAREAISFVLHPPMTRELLPYQVPVRLAARAAVALVPGNLRRLAGIDGSPAVDAVAIASARPALATLTLPLVRETGALIVGSEAHALGKSAMGAGRARQAERRAA
jgi:uncharacterized protein (DUF2236 family)